MKQTRMSVMSHLVRTYGWTRGAELGVWQGALSSHLLDTFPNLHLIGVDHWLAEGPYAEKDMKAAEQLARDVTSKHKRRFDIVKMYTVEAAARVYDQTLDFVFIDAGHDYENVSADILAWQPKLKPTGRLTGHDCNLASVAQALDELLPGWQHLGANVWISPSV